MRYSAHSGGEIFAFVRIIVYLYGRIIRAPKPPEKTRIIMETAHGDFQIRVYLKTELAQLYAPHLTPDAALRKMRKWIHRNPDLYRQLYDEGNEGKNEQAYSKRQVEIIVRYLDTP